jgi:hypothetical protein
VAPGGDPGRLGIDFTLDVIDFDPLYKVQPSKFTLAGLSPAPGTTVEETGKRNRTYRIGRDGKEKATLSRETLEKLSESLRSSGFAAPGR